MSRASYRRKKLEDEVYDILRCYESVVYSDWKNLEDSFTRRTYTKRIIERIGKK